MEEEEMDGGKDERWKDGGRDGGGGPDGRIKT